MRGASNVQKNSSLNSLSRVGLQMLLQAHEYARELDREIWDFAVELPVLQKAGLSSSDLRWLVCKGYADHARETTSENDSDRSFQHQKHLALRKRTCFVLTKAGVDFLRESAIQLDTGNDAFKPLKSDPGELPDGNGQSVKGHVANGGLRLDGSAARKSGCNSLKPTWDCDRQELRLGPQVVKEFKLHSPNQVTILTAFEEEGWPPKIDDPLPPHAEIDVKQRLHDTIKSLNRKQKCRLVRFRGDGTGQGIRWELMKPTSSQPAHLDRGQVHVT